MSEFIHKTEIAALKQSNAELNNLISDLKKELYDLNCEVERLRRENPDDKKSLIDRITELEQREAELKKRSLLISKEAKSKKNKDVIVKQLLSALHVEDAAILEAAIEEHCKRMRAPKTIVAFLLGVLLSLVTWLISTYSENEKIYNTIIEQISKLVN